MAGLKISDIINQGKKPPIEKDMHPMVTFDKAKKIIYDNLVEASERFISTGYYLKLIRDNRMYEEAGFADLWDFAKSTYGIGKSTASRWMAMNDKYSVDGNSPYIQEQYQGYGKSQLQEMLYLTEIQMEQVQPDMTVKEIREIRSPEPAKEETVEEAVVTSQQRGAEWLVTEEEASYPEMENLDMELHQEKVIPEEQVDVVEESVATSQQNWREELRRYLNLILDCLRKESNNMKQMIEAGFVADEKPVMECKIIIDALELLYADKVKRWQNANEE